MLTPGEVASLVVTSGIRLLRCPNPNPKPRTMSPDYSMERPAARCAGRISKETPPHKRR